MPTEIGHLWLPPAGVRLPAPGRAHSNVLMNAVEAATMRARQLGEEFLARIK